MSTLRAPPPQQATPAASGGGGPGPGSSSLSPQTTPTSTTNFPANFPASHPLTPAYFDNNGQPVAVTKLSTVGTASATESHIGEGDDNRTTAGERDEDMLSTGTNYREGGSVTSTAGEHDAMDEDMDRLGQQYDDRMSDDGSASLVGFGEGAGSTVSGPIYHRRPVPGLAAAAANQSAMALERTDSGLSDARRDRDIHMSGGGDTPLSAAAAQERRDARMMDGVAAEPPQPGRAIERDDGFVDTTLRGPVPAPGSSSSPTQEAAEQIVQRLDHGEARAGPAANLSAPASGGDHLGQFYFERNQ